MIDQLFIAEQKKKLLDLRERLKAEIQELKTPMGDGNTASFPDYGASEDENAMEVTQHAIDVDIQSKIGQDLTAINRALVKIADGSYGVCDEGGCAIPVERLKVMPEAVVCAKHAV